MYNAEVLSKFPVIQHFPFGSIFSWDPDPNNNPNNPPHLTSASSSSTPSIITQAPPPPLLSPPIAGATDFPHGQDLTSTLPTVSSNLMNPPPTLAQGRYPPHHHLPLGVVAATAPQRPGGDDVGATEGGTKAPWAKPTRPGAIPGPGDGDGNPPPPSSRKPGTEGMGMTKAPWA